MALLTNELEILPLRDLFNIPLRIPSYQRPYKWSARSTNLLFIDTYEAFQNDLDEYRLGSVILQKDHSNTYNIVDGQQRLTTLSILLYCLGDTDQSLLQEEYSELSTNAILTNHSILSRKTNELNSDEQVRFKNYLLEKCTTVQIVTDKEQEAFQFFDSQNSRGKALAPHDLLKSYHLREMTAEDESQKVNVISRWEAVNQEDLSNLFKNYLYPLTQWYKGKHGLGYSSSKIDAFKGIDTTHVYNYALYHKASNLFIEQFNKNGHHELLASNSLNQFQLTQPLVAGKRFFDYILHYGQLLEQIQKLIKQSYPEDENQIPRKGTGDTYIMQLFECSLLFFADRFGIESLNKSVLDYFYTWSYSLRLVMNAIYQETTNKYAIGKHERLNVGLGIFTIISEMNTPTELDLYVLEQPAVDLNNKKKYQAVYNKLSSLNGWC
ncbi:DUF262 domain-containing protein [Exiguobacterium sp. TBG-PICH-001]|uniref:DUF262 domain-containing protein n=1 Tax=Exiguobacterium abrahamii TaxID=2785532 RepID=UPI0018A76568|nr:DUF262 domain-containing protein [Exiguobacterium sp. TBG-PICH-001]MBF8153998.1 DUF262 domain-containing protein [Exiguobacterium sp. TBG-PICH-001]